MTASASFPAKALHNLARRVASGDVIFFIGSGFSIDSEGNSASRLIGRLLIRLMAMTDVLAVNGCAEAADVITRLRGTFDLRPDPDADAYLRFTDKQLRELSTRYYETNDWFCVAYGRLLGLVHAMPQERWDAIIEEISAREEEIRAGVTASGKVLKDSVPFLKIDRNLIALASGGDPIRSRLAGKALFLDTMGFRDEAIMGGDPTLSNPRDAMDSYGNRILPRHHVIARFAREGFCSTTITANFDLLLEGAFRVAGFTMTLPAETGPRETESFSPPTHIDHFVRIASPAEFFSHGKAHRSAILVKMHGCAQRYRGILHDQTEALSTYLPSMVFTYREIQNWRQDWWAADYLRTLLRTRTVVFCGYSVQDPVIHDTFRTVYEDMSKVAGANGCASTAKPDANAAPAFFLAPGDTTRSEFHGTEVLQAASRALGTQPPPFGDHPNYLRFNFRGKPDFPDIDEQFQWLEHAVVRERQQQCLDAFLYRSVTGLLGRPQPEVDLTHVRERFRQRREAEASRADQWDNSDSSRREHAAICGWSSQFHAGLLREFAAIEMAQSKQGPSDALSRMRELPWYYPTTAAGGWTCWGVVIELALRNMIDAAWGDVAENPLRPRIRAAESLAPTVYLAPPPDPNGVDLDAPIALVIRFCGFDRHGDEPRIAGRPVRKVTWELCPQDAPWPLHSTPPAERRVGGTMQNRRLRAPDATTIWQWAVAPRSMDDELRKCLGLIPHDDH